MTSRPRAEPSRRAIAEPLVKKNKPTEIVAWFCTNCGTVYKTKEDAERCTTRRRNSDRNKDCTEWNCEECGQPAFSVYQWYCHDCLSELHRRKEDEKLAAAPTIKPDDYPDNQPVKYNNEFFCNLDDFIDDIVLDGGKLPKRVWATKPDTFKLDADAILDNSFEEWVKEGDDFDIADLCGEKEFKAAVQAFNEKQTIRIYWEDSTAIDLSKFEFLKPRDLE